MVYAQNSTILGPDGVNISSVPQTERQLWCRLQLVACDDICGDNSTIPRGQEPQAINQCDTVRPIHSCLQISL